MKEETMVRIIKGNDAQQEEYIDFINYVFHFNGTDNDFYRLLPKLYKREYHPCPYNYMVLEKERIKAAVGSYPGEMNVGGTSLKYMGIGNVAVNPYSRSKGYMKELMNQAVNQMLQEDVDFSVLGGRRQRYSYFSYEIVGRKYSFRVSDYNILHTLGENRKVSFEFINVKETDREMLQSISLLQKKQPLHSIREEKKLYDILCTWSPVDIYGILEGTRFAGYLLYYEKDHISEILLEQEEDITNVIADFITQYAKDGVTIDIPDYQRCFIDSLSLFAESITMKNSDNFTVFHYDRVIEAFLRLKSQTGKLADGEAVLFIHGRKREERLLISVKDNQICVTPSDRETVYEYSHLEAMSLLFGNYSALRSKLPFEVQSWLPLPIYLFPADGV